MSLAQVAPEQTVAAAEVPKVTLELITGTKEGVARPGGIFTKDDLINIKLYVKKGLSLPSPIGQVEVYVGYKKAGIAGLEPSDIKNLFDQIIAHCLCWDGVERNVIGQNINLQNSAKKIVSTGDSLIENIEEWPFSMKSMKLEEARALEFKFSMEDKEVAKELGEYLDLLKSEIEYQQKKTQEVHNSVHNFRVVLSGGELVDHTFTPGLEPQVKQKRDLMEQNNLFQKIEADEKNIKEKEDSIEQLNKDYNKYVELSFTGAAGGPVGLMFTGGIFGAKAEKARKEKNKLSAEVRELRAKVGEEKNLQQAILALQDDFSDLGIRMIDAQQAMEHLGFMWESMLALITSSKDEWDNVDNGKSLRYFLAVFKTIIDPWRDIGDLSGQLMKSMDEGLAEYKKLYAK